MSGAGIKISNSGKAAPRTSSLGRAILFIIPSIIITVVSVILFSKLDALTPAQANTLSVTIITAIVLSLMGMAGIQVLIYRVIESREHFSDGAAYRGLRAGIIYSLVYSIVLIIVLYPLFTGYLHLSPAGYMYFSILLFLFSATWVLVSVFWGSEKYGIVAAIFIFSYLAIFIFSIGAYQINPVYTIIGYTGGTAVLFTLFFLTGFIYFKRPKKPFKVSGDFVKMSSLFFQNSAAVLFNILYVLAIFLDKFIVWIFQGIISGQALSISGAYTIGSFLGLMPMFSIMTIAYFTYRVKPLIEDRYNGTFSEIQQKVKRYKKIYQAGFTATWLLALFIAATVIYITYFTMYDYQVMQVLIAVSLGSVFLALILFISAALSVFGKTCISLYSILAVILAEILSIPFISLDVWYSAAGFLVGSFAGFLFSYFSIKSLFANYEYNMFGLLLKI